MAIDLMPNEIPSPRHNLDAGIKAKEEYDSRQIRPLFEIAREIQKDWKNVYFGAVPYLEAMRELTNIGQDYYQDSGKSVVLYFLANAGTWKGEVARRVKAELKGLAK